jgi:transposase-like protein
VQVWNARDLDTTRYPFVLVDALVIKVRGRWPRAFVQRLASDGDR